MKTMMKFTVVLLMATAFMGCSKNGDSYAAADPIVGSWMLRDASRNNNYGWQSFYSGLENGVLEFYNNGSASYSEGHLNLTGNWYVSNTNGAYYDEYGYLRNGLHQTLYVSLSDRFSGNSIELNFGYVVFQGSRFIATDFYGNGVERYEFRRY